MAVATEQREEILKLAILRRLAAVRVEPHWVCISKNNFHSVHYRRGCHSSPGVPAHGGQTGSASRGHGRGHRGPSLVAVPSLLLAWLDRTAVVALSLETDA